MMSLAPILRMVIGFHGLPGAGKNSITDYLKDQYGMPAFGFGDALYGELAEAYSIDPDTLRDRRTKELPSDDLATIHCSDPDFRDVVFKYDVATQSHWQAGRKDSVFKPRSPRQLLQLWGTEYRRKQSVDYWITRLHSKFKIAQMTSTVPCACIYDVRCIPEAAYIKRGGLGDLGGQFDGTIIEVLRPGLVAGTHSSDIRLDDTMIDAVIRNDGSIIDLCRQADHLVGKL